MVEKLWSKQRLDIPITNIMLVDESIKNLDTATINSTWQGVTPVQLVDLIANITRKRTTAHKTATQINVIMQDKITEIWRETNKRRSTQVTAKHTIDYARLLHEKGLLLSNNQLLSATSPVQTLNEFRQLSRKHRENIVDKRLKTLGISYGDPIPEEGDIIRSYEPPGKVALTIVQSVNYKTNVCKVRQQLKIGQVNGIRKLGQARTVQIATAAQHIVDDTGVTKAERNLCDRFAQVAQEPGTIRIPPKGICAIKPHPSNEDAKAPRAILIAEDGSCSSRSISDLVQTHNLSEVIIQRSRGTRHPKGRKPRVRRTKYSQLQLLSSI